MQTTILSEGEYIFFLRAGILFMKREIIFSEASKSAITPSLSGRMVFIFSWVFPCIRLAYLLTAIIFPVIRFRCTIEGLSITTLSLLFINVLDVTMSMSLYYVI